MARVAECEAGVQLRETALAFYMSRYAMRRCPCRLDLKLPAVCPAEGLCFDIFDLHAMPELGR